MLVGLSLGRMDAFCRGLAAQVASLEFTRPASELVKILQVRLVEVSSLGEVMMRQLG